MERPEERWLACLIAEAENPAPCLAEAENMLFRVGQHVELCEHPWHDKNPGPVPPDMHLQLGDRFTVRGYSGVQVYNLMFHKDGTIACLSGGYLKEVR